MSQFRTASQTLMPNLPASLLHFAANGSCTIEPATLSPDAVAWAIHTGLGPLCDLATTRLTGELKDQLHASALGAHFTSADQQTALLEILAHCQDLGRPVTLLKGMSISHQYYPEPQLRVMRDIDILVDENDLTTIENRLQSLGYRQESPLPPEYYREHHHSMPFFHPQKGIWMEIHTQLFRHDNARARIAAFSSATIRQEMCVSRFGDFDVLRLTPELQLAYIASHWADTFKPVGGLIPMLDIIYLMQHEGAQLDLDKLKYLLGTPLAATPVRVILEFLEHNRVDVFPAVLAAWLRQTKTTTGLAGNSILQRMVTEYYAKGRAFDNVNTDHNLSVIWATLFQPSPWPNALRLPWNILFPPGNPERFMPGRQWRRLLSALRRG
ncbi:MAG TPA: hypothetical protein ENJ80_13235 [Gammaproteobacteria bacterium]|nr:hypothetical protein [Gammaproteobacteria bacterium]